MKKFRSTKISRLTSFGGALIKAGSQLALNEIEKKAKKFESEAGENIRKIKAAKAVIESMGELKGAVMKIGQMLSVTEDMLLPPEVTKLFEKLQKDAPTISFDQMRDVIINELGESPEVLFKEFDTTPLASASIGQVYRATTHDDIKVAVKVQYPKIKEAIESDLKNLDKLSDLFKLFVPNSPKLDDIIHEVATSMIEECDYTKELNNILLFRETFSENSIIKIVEPISELCSEKVLTTKFIEGDHFNQTLNYSQETRNKFGDALYRFHLEQFFKEGLLHTDPQYGNYLFTPQEIYMIDFGSIRKFPKDFILPYSLMTYSIRTSDFENYKRACFDLNIFSEKDSEELLIKSLKVTQSIYLPYLEEGTYSPRDINPFEIIRSFVGDIGELSQRPTPRKEFILLDRTNLGLFTKLKKWRSEVNWLQGHKDFQLSREEEAIKYFS